MTTNNHAEQRFISALANMPLAGDGDGFNNQALPRAVFYAKLAKIDAEEAIHRILETQKNAKRKPEDEIRSTVTRMYEQEDGPRGARKPKWAEYSETRTANILQTPTPVVTVAENSPTKDLASQPPTYFLTKVFLGDPLVSLGMASKNAATETVSSFATRLKGQDCGFEFVVPSPAVKRYGKNKNGRGSWKCDDMFGRRQHIVVEFDHTTKDEAATLLWHLGTFAPLQMVLDSGRRSLHGWFPCEGVAERDVWDFFNYAVSLGADPAMWTLSQFARLPNAVRENTGRLQEVLYFDETAAEREWTLEQLPGRKTEFRSILNIPDDVDDDSNLIGDRFLTRGKGVFVIGPTGVGKSTMIVQEAIEWAYGGSALGLRPQQPLRTLILQAESDNQEMGRMVGGVTHALQLTQEQLAQVGENVFYANLNGYEHDWTREAEPFIEKWKPDLLILDPLFAYLLGSVSDQREVSTFLRRTVQPFLEKHQVGCIINHHTNKPPTSKDKGEWSHSQYAYAGSGSVELANWARGVIVLKTTDERDLFELHVAKRGKQAGLVDLEGKPTDRIYVRHSNESIFWEIATPPATRPEQEIDDLAVGFLRARKNGEATIKAIAKKLDISERTINRRFKEQNPIEIPQAADREALKLLRVAGKIVNLLETEAQPKAATI